MSLSVVHIVRYYYPSIGGNENQARLLCNALRTYYPFVNIIVLTSRYSVGLNKKEMVDNIMVYRVKYRLYSYLNVRLINKLNFILEEYIFLLGVFKYLIRLKKDYSLIHVHQSAWLGLFVSFFGKILNKPVVIKEATYDGFSFLPRLGIPTFFRHFALNNSYFVAISNEIFKNLQTSIKFPGRLYRINNGSVLKSNYDFEYNFNVNRLLFVGNYVHGDIKGLDVLINALSFVESRKSDFEVIIVGKGDPSVYTKNLSAALLSKIKFDTNCSDPSNYYKNCTFFVLPSRSEGSSNALIEAISFGLPCLATNVSGVSECIHNGKNGFIVESGNSSQLANAILMLFNSTVESRQKMHQYSLKLSNKFNISEIVIQYVNLYKSIK